MDTKMDKNSRYRKAIITLGVILLVLCFVVSYYLIEKSREFEVMAKLRIQIDSENNGDFPIISIEKPLNDGTIKRVNSFWKENKYYCLIPSFMSDRIVFYNKSQCISVFDNDNNEIYDGETIDVNVPVEVLVQIYNYADGKTKAYTLHIEKTKNIASLFMQTDNLEFVHEDKSNKGKMSFEVVDTVGNLDSKGEGTIKCHGDSSYNRIDKKTYKLKLTKRTSVLGMDSAKKWILQANVFDESKLRNRISYYIADLFELPYAVNTEYVDLYINDNYYGCYLIMDSVDVAKNRVDIKKEGSWMIVADTEEENGFYDLFDQHFSVKYPETFDEKTIESIRNSFVQAEEKIQNLQKQENLDKIENIIDTKSFAIMYLVDFITDEPDSNHKSTYYYYDAQDKLIHAGPAWDFDRGYEAQVAPFVEVNSYIDGLPELLYRNSFFKEKVKKILDNKPSYESEIETFFDQSEKLIEYSCKMDFYRWGGTEELADKRLIDKGSYAENALYVKENLLARLKMATEKLRINEDYCTIYVKSANSFREAFIRKGEALADEAFQSLCKIYNCQRFDDSNGDSFQPGKVFSDSMTIVPILDLEE